MPSTFSEDEETPIQQQGLDKQLKNRTNVKSYNNCLVETNLSNLYQENSFQTSPNHVYISEELEEDSVVETTALRQKPAKSSSNEAILSDGYLTVPGTIKRGKKKAQSVEVVLNMSREELETLEANITTKKGFFCKAKNGFGCHILLWTIFCFPFSIIISGVYSFGMGTITWYNVFKLFSENKTLGYRILFPPLLIILYPFLIISISLGLGLYAGLKQISCCWDSWLKEFTDYEKGFYAWLCNSLDIPECCPYEVVILSSIQKS